METLTRDDARRQKAGGVAALYLALAYIAAMPYFLLVVDYQGATTAAEKVALVVANYPSMYAMYLATYVLFGIALGVLALALYDRLQAGAPSTVRVATGVGLLWAVALVASGMVFTYGMTTVVALAKTDPGRPARLAGDRAGRAGAGRGRRRVPRRTVGPAGELGGAAKRRAAEGPRLARRGHRRGRPRLGRPAAHDAAIAFGLLQIVWFVWVGVALVTTKATAAEPDRLARAGAAQVERLGGGCARLRETRISRSSESQAAAAATRRPRSRREWKMNTNERATGGEHAGEALDTVGVHHVQHGLRGHPVVHVSGVPERGDGGTCRRSEITPGFLLLAAVLAEVPIAMIVLSRVLKHRANRWANIVAGVITIAYVAGGSSTYPHGIFFTASRSRARC